MGNKYCKHCEFFIQHYVKLRNRYVAAGCGHCIDGRAKNCAPEKDICNHFLEIPSKKEQNG